MLQAGEDALGDLHRVLGCGLGVRGLCQGEGHQLLQVADGGSSDAMTHSISAPFTLFIAMIVDVGDNVNRGTMRTNCKKSVLPSMQKGKLILK